MSQTVSASYASQSVLESEAPDYALVIAGWPTIYTVARSYAPAGKLAGFSSVQAWASVPSAAAASPKGRPEEGELSIGMAEITVLDRRVRGVRQLSDLLSRQAYLQGTSPGLSTTLTAALDNGLQPANNGIVGVASTAGFPGSGTIYVGLECISYSATTVTSFGSAGNPVSRGQLLTSQSPHPIGAGVYSFPPAVFRQKAFVYKGFQTLTLDQWYPAFGGVIVGAEKQGPGVVFSLASTTWNAHGDGNQVLFGGSRFATDPPISASVSTTNLNPGDSHATLTFPALMSIPLLGNGHYLANLSGEWVGIAQPIGS